MWVQQVFGYTLGQYSLDGSITLYGSWNQSNPLTFFFSPSSSYPVCGIAFYVNNLNTGNFQVAIHAGYDTAIPEFPYGGSFGRLAYSRVTVPIPPQQPGRVKLMFDDFRLVEGYQYAIWIYPESSNNTVIFGGLYHMPRLFELSSSQDSYVWVRYIGYGTLLYYRFGVQILFRMPDGSAKAFEPLYYGFAERSSTSDIRIRFSIPYGLKIRVNGVQVGDIYRSGSPGLPKFSLWRGSDRLTGSFPLPYLRDSSVVYPNGVVPHAFFYFPFTDSVLLTHGNTYELRFEVDGTHDSSNYYIWKMLLVDLTDVHEYWTYRCFVNGVEDTYVLPCSLIFTLDLESPYA